jgi:tricorn protease-like protein
MKKLVIILMVFVVILSADVQVIKSDILDLGNNTIQPVFSQDGQYLVFGSQEGASYYRIDDKSLTRFAESAFDYSMDAEGNIRYRVDSFVNGLRMNSVKVFESKYNKTTTIIDKKRLDIVPTITDHGVYFIENNALKTDNSLAKSISKPVVFSYDHSLLLYTYGTSKTMRPAGEEKFYIWPSVSPNNDKLCFVDINDLFVSDLNGNIEFKIKEARAPKWSPDGKWIAFMRDSDDGHVFTSSEIYLLRVADQEVFQLTNSEDRIEMFPSWSPDGTQIICEDAANDEFILLTLEIK